ncbi:MAG TPA: DUF177 domain-containing protein [Clostridia bacterium]|jgi:uncharacterized protein|nr:DUF177 domain-containing protein [Clostridia bacterium]
MAGDFMLVDISSLRIHPGQTRDYELTAKLDDIIYGGERLSFDSPIHLQLNLTNIDHVIHVKGKIQADLQLKCARCISLFSYHLETEVHGEFHKEKNTETLNPEREDYVYFYSGNTIDLTDMVVENILLDFPMKVVCCEDCKGLCPICGTNLNEYQCNCHENDIDPRLAVLQKLVNTSTGKEG